MPAPAARPADSPAGPPEPPPGPPASPPVGQHLARTAKEVTRAFDDALSGAGGSQPIWLVLISLKTRRLARPRELPDAQGGLRVQRPAAGRLRRRRARGVPAGARPAARQRLGRARGEQRGS